MNAPAPDPVPIPTTECPLCGGPNACGPAACGSFDVPCWCTSTPIPAALIDRLPAEVRGKACICAGCVARHGAA
ncbi:MAG: cysteine-rich CWC family protein [Pseudazoarcus pumilus]|nr:cysteine-rich CWC family protein [Pseudazoarcus pumilus]